MRLERGKGRWWRFDIHSRAHLFVIPAQVGIVSLFLNEELDSRLRGNDRRAGVARTAVRDRESRALIFPTSMMTGTRACAHCHAGNPLHVNRKSCQAGGKVTGVAAAATSMVNAVAGYA